MSNPASKTILLLGFLFCLSLASVASLRAEALHIRVLDVGEGQSVLFHKNGRAILIDTGHAGAARSVLDRIRQLQINALDILILTHLHPDHASGFFRIHEDFPGVTVADSCFPVSTDMTLDMIRWVDRHCGRLIIADA
ncbi:MAG TPA: MBL fold metallo-hydrolase [Geopsychrobacteraceae bacterium]|nr:MBL fold metallo-hydrolase [Geopsychrobacteraceae bacterium]